MSAISDLLDAHRRSTTLQTALAAYALASDAIHALHRPTTTGICRECRRPHPCPTLVLLATADQEQP